MSATLASDLILETAIKMEGGWEPSVWAIKLKKSKLVKAAKEDLKSCTDPDEREYLHKLINDEM